MQTIPDITVGSTAWVDVNTESGLVVGTKMSVMLKTSWWCRLYEGATAPALDYTGGVLLTDLTHPHAIATIPTDSLKIWALCTREGFTCKLSVQGV
jgi:hypothetical protein